MRYGVFFLATLALAALSVLLWPFNLVTALLMAAAAPIVSLLGGVPPGGWSSLGPTMLISLYWPLSLAPLHYVAFRRLHWRLRGYALLLFGAGVAASVVIDLCSA